MLGGSLEENILTALCWNDALAPHIAVSLKPSDFSIQVYRKIANAGFDFLSSHHRPAKAHIGDLLEHEIKRGPDGRFTQEVLEQMSRLAPSLNEDYVRSTLDRFVETQRLINAVNNASELLHEGDLEQAREVLRAPDLIPPDSSPGVWLRNGEEWLRFLSRDEGELFSSGIDVLDDRGVRPARGELMILLAATNMGKSWFLVNVGKHNVLGHRKNVLHITLENSLDMTLQRYTQSLLALTDREARRLDLGGLERNAGPSDDPEHARWVPPRAGGRDFQAVKDIGRAELLERLKPYQNRGQLLVKHFPTGTLTLGMLNAYLDMLATTENFKPDMILLDYITMMHLVSVRDEYRITLGQLARNLRGLAELRNCAMVTVAQANREAVDRQWISAVHTGEDWSLPGTSDVFMTYNQTPFERGRHVARILVDKARNAQAKWSAFITQAYPIGQFCLDSVYMKDMKDQLIERAEC